LLSISPLLRLPLADHGSKSPSQQNHSEPAARLGAATQAHSINFVGFGAIGATAADLGPLPG
jgi:hypothetical protein